MFSTNKKVSLYGNFSCGVIQVRLEHYIRLLEVTLSLRRFVALMRS